MTLPADLAAFRALMEAVAETLNAYSCWCDSIDRAERVREWEAQCNALATATPAQLCGIACVIRDEYMQDTAGGPVAGWYVTPREGA